MNDDEIRQHAQATCNALVTGDVDRLIGDLSDELRRNAGEVVALLPLPVSEASVTSVERNGQAFVVAIQLVGETEEVELQTRWKERDGAPRIVEASHAHRAPTPPQDETEETEEALGAAE
jgi:hypothetical protein